MTELEALTLRPGDKVVGRRPGQMGQHMIVEGIQDCDFSPEMAQRLLKLIDIDEARRFAFDGPIIYCQDLQQHRVIWRAPYIAWPKLECTFRCSICARDVDVQINVRGYSKYTAGWRPSSVCFPDESQALTTFLDSRVCRQCNPYYKGPLILVEINDDDSK